MLPEGVDHVVGSTALVLHVNFIRTPRWDKALDRPAPACGRADTGKVPQGVDGAALHSACRSWLCWQPCLWVALITLRLLVAGLNEAHGVAYGAFSANAIPKSSMSFEMIIWLARRELQDTTWRLSASG